MFEKPYIIAEACINHNGDFDTAIKMIQIASDLKVDCIKFQIHSLENEMLKETPQSSNFSESLWDTLEKTNFTIEEHVELKNICNKNNIDYLCTPFSKNGVDLLEEIDVDFYKTGSGEMTNHPLIEYVAKKGKPMIISTGMCHYNEIVELVKLVKSYKIPFILTNCTSAYPCPYDRVNLGLIKRYHEDFSVSVGLSDHTIDNYSSFGAVAYGAAVIEKHFTLNKNQIGPDHQSSIDPKQLSELVKGCNAIYRANGSEKYIFPEEEEIIAWARESVVSETNINEGEIISEKMIWVKRPGPYKGSIPAKDYNKVLGRVAFKDIKKNTQIKWSDLE
jgi:N-acetylneuraminate synthase